jgi:hypothetical protein
MAHLAEYVVSTVSLPLPDFLFDCQMATVPEDLFAYEDDAASETASLSRTVCTKSDSSSVHTPDSTCAFLHGTPVALALMIQTQKPSPHCPDVLSCYVNISFARLPLGAMRLWMTQHCLPLPSLRPAVGLVEQAASWRHTLVRRWLCNTCMVFATCVALHPC